MGITVTRVTQDWEYDYPFYPQFVDFYNSSGFLYPNNGKTLPMA
jgi:hypothetical protein